MNFGWWKTLLLAVVIAACIAVIVVDILMLVGTDNFVTSSPAVAGVSLAAAAIIVLAASLLLFNSFYAFKDKEFVSVLGFFVDKISYDDIDTARQNTETKELTLVLSNGDGQQELRLYVSAAKSDAFLNVLREKCPSAIVELFTPPSKEEKQ